MAVLAACAGSSSVSGILAAPEMADGRSLSGMVATDHRTARGGGADARRKLEVIAVRNLGVHACRAALYRCVKPRTRLLLCVSESPRCPEWLTRALLRSADAVVADGDDAVSTVLKLSAGRPSVFAIPDSDRNVLATFLRCPGCRTAREAHRLVFASDLCPQAGAAEFLTVAMAWAERNRDRVLEICWIGIGLLKGVLKAQPVPPNLKHRFIDPPPAPEIASLFAESGILVAPTAYSDHGGHPILQALAAALPVLGSVRCRAVRQWVSEGETGWVFDPVDPRAIFDALDAALTTSPEKLNQMRKIARSEVEAAAGQSIQERVRRAVDMLLQSSEPGRLSPLRTA